MERPDPLAELAALGGDPDGLSAQARPLGPQPGSGPRRVEIADMVLPPAHLVDDLDNSTAAKAAQEPADEEVTLDFFGEDLPVRAFPLRHPFSWAGERVEVIEVHQLTTAEVGDVIDEMRGPDGGPDVYVLYGRMCRVRGTGTRLPPRVLRKLPGADGLPIVGHCYDFLRRCFQVEAA